MCKHSTKYEGIYIAEMCNLRAFRVKRETQKVHFEMIDVVNLKMHR